MAMDEIESEAQSFIVRVWVEERAIEGRQGTWRGHITHVPGGERRYLKNLCEIEDFISPFLEDMGVKLKLSWRMRRWFERLSQLN